MKIFGIDFVEFIVILAMFGLAVLMIIIGTSCSTFDLSQLPEIPWEDVLISDGEGAPATTETNTADPEIGAPSASIISAEGHRASFLWDGANTRTLNFSSPHITDDQFAAMVARCNDNGDNAFYIYTGYNQADGPGAGYSIYTPAHDIGGKLDRAAINRIRKRMEYAITRGLRIVGWIRADDSKAWSKVSAERHANLNRDCAEQFGDLVSLWVVGLELNEYSGKSEWISWVQQMKTFAPGTPVAVHFTSGDKSNDALQTGADAYLVQYGFSMSADKCAGLTKTVRGKVGDNMAVIGSEYDKNSGSAGAKAKGDAIAAAGAGTGCGRSK